MPKAKSDMAASMAVCKKINELGGKIPKLQILVSQSLRQMRSTPRNPLQQFRKYKG